MKLPSIPLIPDPKTSESESALGFKWAPASVGNRHRIGGEPDWLQSDQTPTCSCGLRMDFYAQLDSVGDKFCLADCGMIYVFVCWNCFESKSILQSS
jgi:hypothetical protein